MAVSASSLSVTVLLSVNSKVSVLDVGAVLKDLCGGLMSSPHSGGSGCLWSQQDPGPRNKRVREGRVGRQGTFSLALEC